MKVRCTDAHGTRLLAEGRIYVVDRDEGTFYQLALVPGVWSATRFEAAP